MVADAPKFHEVAKDIVEFTKDCIFVAHNVQFDYGFVQSEFKRLGFIYQRRRLCTVRLGRSIIPGYKSYSLGNITRDLGISLVGAHRAMNDAVATSKLFEILLKKDVNDEINSMLNHGVVATRLPKEITIEKLQALPEFCGVYYFYNAQKEVIYVGKSINIRKRVMEHLANKQAKAQRMVASITDISVEITGSELIALRFVLLD
jgi:DNA polymerase III subunit epsilon